MKITWPKIAILVLWGVILTIALYSVLLIGEGDRLHYDNIPFPTNDDVYIIGGDPVTFQVERCLRGRKSVEYQFLVDLVSTDTHNVTYSLPSGDSFAEPGCTMVSAQPKEIPAYVQPGKYKLAFEVVYRDRFRNHILKGMETTEFQLIHG